jgi:hypothetical protein
MFLVLVPILSNKQSFSSLVSFGSWRHSVLSQCRCYTALPFPVLGD